MSSEQKAKEIVKKYHSLEVSALNYKQVYIGDAKEQAKICVDEIINSKSNPNTNYTIEVLEDIQYWKDVLTKIDKL